jgi:DUF3078 family protein
MRKIALSMLCVFGMINAFAQETPTEVIQDTTKHWTRKGTFILLFNQAAFNNDWLAGGTSSFSGNTNINYDFNYKKDDWTWDNKIMIAYGLTKVRGTDNPNKTDDRIEFNSLLGKKASGYWYYSLFFNGRTQLDSGSDKDNNKISHFFSPAYFQFGPGMLWKQNDNLKVNISPATAKMIFVHQEFTEFGPSYGVEQGDTSRFEFGASISAYYKFAIMANITSENILNLYSNYLDKPENIDINYQMNLVMKVNKYVSTNLAFQAIYDDDAIGAFQIREIFGIGINFIF